MKKIITGDWDGQPIWREQTAEEVLQKALAEKPTMKYENPRIRAIQVQAMQKVDKPLSKYNFPLLEHTAELVGEPSDRSAYDVGGELQTNK